MRLDDIPPSENIEDRRNDPPILPKPKKLVYPEVAPGKSDIELPEEKRLPDEPTGDIGREMQPVRGYGKAERYNRWKVR